MLKKLLLTLIALLAALVVVIALQPSEWQVTRSLAIRAPAGVPYAAVVDLRRWAEWSPWEKLDPAMKRTFTGEGGAVGSTYGWDGNSAVGAGKLTLLETRPAERIRFRLEFYQPMPDECPTTFEFRPAGGQTVVTWTMAGKHNFLSKAICLFVSMDKMIGTSFEQGLARLKEIAEPRG